ncbi:MAG: DNA repair protein RadC [Candidatus Nanoarchaeia archaeon]
MRIFDLPSFNRPDSKLIRKGAKNLDEAELLSILFWEGSYRESALEMSNRLLKKYNLNKLEDLGFNELLREFKGDKVKVLKVLSLIELFKRYNKLKREGFKNSISCAKDVYDLLVDEYGNEKKEYFICLYLDVKNKIIKRTVVSIGTLDSSLAHPREIFKEAIRESAKSIILVHNHPSGDCNPSEGDIFTTVKIKEVGEILNIPLLDHIILGKDNYYSFKEKFKL